METPTGEPETVSASELSEDDQIAVEIQLELLWARYVAMTSSPTKELKLTAPPDFEELSCQVFPNGFTCHHGKYYLSCNWEDVWCQAGDSYPGDD